MAFGGSYTAYFTSLLAPHLEGMVFAFVGWSLVMFISMIENASRKKAKRDVRELGGKLLIYTILIVFLTFIHVISKQYNLGYVVNGVAFICLTAYFYIFLSEFSLIRRNFNQRYQKRFNLSWFDKIVGWVEIYIVKKAEKACDIERKEDEE